MTIEEAVKYFETQSSCAKCDKDHTVVIRQPIGGWAAYYYCYTADCDYGGPWVRLSACYYDSKEELEHELITEAHHLSTYR